MCTGVLNPLSNGAFWPENTAGRAAKHCWSLRKGVGWWGLYHIFLKTIKVIVGILRDLRRARHKFIQRSTDIPLRLTIPYVKL